jgi:hypothetical protein
MIFFDQGNFDPPIGLSALSVVIGLQGAIGRIAFYGNALWTDAVPD